MPIYTKPICSISLFYIVCSKFQVFQHFIHYKISGISPFIKSFFIRIIYNMVIIWNITKHPYQTSIFHTTEEACYAYPMVLNALRQGGIYKSVTHKVNTANVCKRPVGTSCRGCICKESRFFLRQIIYPISNISSVEKIRFHPTALITGKINIIPSIYRRANIILTIIEICTILYLIHRRTIRKVRAGRETSSQC